MNLFGLDRLSSIGIAQSKQIVPAPYLRAEPDPTKVSTDSKSARDVAYNPEQHDRMKHVERRHFFVRDMVESFEVEMPFVRTHDQLADLLAKPMRDASQFHKLRKVNDKND